MTRREMVLAAVLAAVVVFDVAALLQGCKTTTTTLSDGTVESMRALDVDAISAVAAIAEQGVPIALDAWAKYEAARTAVKQSTTAAQVTQRLQELQTVVEMLHALAPTRAGK